MALGATAESEEERSLRDDLAAGLKEISEREADVSAAPDDEGAQAPEADANAEPADTEADRGDGRDAHGRFVKKEGTASEADAGSSSPEGSQSQETKQPQDQSTPQAQSSPEQSGQDTDVAPKSWRADEAKVWSQLPPEAKAAISRREAETARLAGANDSERLFGREMADIFRPHVAEIQAQNATPQQALQLLLNNHNALRSNDPNVKFGTARRLLAEYGIDPAQLAGIQLPDRHITELQNEVAQLRQRLARPEGEQFAPLPPSADESNVLAEIEAFRADPAHPHFDAVRPVMGQLLETGAAPDLGTAYAMAVAANPALRSTVAPQAQPQRTQQQKTAAARQASVSVAGSPGPTGSQAPLTLRDELREGLRNAGFGSA